MGMVTKKKQAWVYEVSCKVCGKVMNSQYEAQLNSWMTDHMRVHRGLQKQNRED